MPFWHYVDVYILADVQGYARNETIDPNLVPVDLDAKDGKLRAPALALLEAICKPSGDPAQGAVKCTQRALSLPQWIALDIQFIEGAGDARLVTPLANVLIALREVNVPVYGAHVVLPSDKPVAALYAAMGGIGHTEMQVVPYVPTGFAWYRRYLGINGERVVALPLVIGGISGAAAPTADGEEIVPIGPHNVFMAASTTAERAQASLRDETKLGPLQAGIFSKKGLVIGNGPTDAQLPGSRNAFEVVAWAISDRLANAELTSRLGTKPDTILMLILTVVCSVLAAILYMVVFPRVRTRKFGYAIAYVAATAATFVALAAIDGLLLANSRAFSQLSLAGIGTLTAAGVATLASSEAVRHERFLTSMWAAADNRPEDQFDVFISYARDPENAAWVVANVYEPLSRALGSEGKPLKIFFDRDSIQPGKDWYERIVRSIHGSRVFVPVYSRGYFQRWFCRDELELALLRRRDNPNFVLPLTRIGYKLPKRYASIQAIDANSPLLREDLIRILTQPPAKTTSDPA